VCRVFAAAELSLLTPAAALMLLALAAPFHKELSEAVLLSVLLLPAAVYFAAAAVLFVLRSRSCEDIRCKESQQQQLPPWQIKHFQH